MRTKTTVFARKAHARARFIDTLDEIFERRAQRETDADHPRPTRIRKKLKLADFDIERPQPANAFADEPREGSQGFFFHCAEKTQRQVPALRPHPANQTLAIGGSKLGRLGRELVAQRRPRHHRKEGANQETGSR